MVQAKELRIGNWVYLCDEESETPKLPHQIKIHSFGMVDFMELIPLTPEMLEKAGFVLLPQKKSIYIKGRLKLWLGHNGAIAYLKHEDNDNSYYIPNNPKALHQLQNLYYSLMGDELEINL